MTEPVELPPGYARRIRRGSVAMAVNLLLAAVILGAASVVEAGIATGNGGDRSWVIYLGVLPALLMLVLGYHMQRIRNCVEGDTLDYAAVDAVRPALRRWWIITVVAALVVIVAILALDFAHGGNDSSFAIFGALPVFLDAVVANTTYGVAKSWFRKP